MNNKNDETKSFDEQKDEKQEFTFNNLLRGKRFTEDDVYSFKVCDLVDEYKKLSGITLFPRVVAHSAMVCNYEGTMPSKETLLQNFGDANLEYFVQFSDEDKTMRSAICSFKCKLNHVFQNGKRLVDEVKFEPFKSRRSQQVYIQAYGFDNSLLLDENVEIQPYGYKRCSQSQKDFEIAACKAILKQQTLKNNNLENHNLVNNTPKHNTIENGKGKE